MHSIRNSHRGFIALISAIIISTILLSLATAVAASTLFARFDALNSEYKRVSLGLAESCVNAALLKIAQNYTYAPAVGGETVSIGANSCIIKAATYSAEVNGKKTVTLATQGQFRGAFSNVTVSAIIQNPATAPVVPPPNCTLIASPTSIPSGSDTWLLWSTSSNAAQFSIDHGIGNVTPVAAGQIQIHPTGVGTATYIGTATNAGGSNTCSVTITVLPPPPAPSCADTVMMLDRTGSMSSSDLTNERTAANALLGLYDDLSPLPQASIGVFGDPAVGSSPYPARIVQPLTNVFSSLYNAVASYVVNDNGGTNLASAISLSADELHSARHIAGKQKVLILVSDGLATHPSSLVGDTGWLSPTATASPNEWSTPDRAYTSNNSYTTADDDNDDQGYRNFNFVIPNGADIEGIEVQVEAFSQVSTSAVTVLNDGFGTGGDDNDIDNWDEEGSDNDSTTLARQAQSSGEDSASPDGARFARIADDEWICRSINADNDTSLMLRYYWRGDAQGESSDLGRVEYRTSGNCTDTNGWIVVGTHALNATSWSGQQSVALPATLNDSTFLLRFRTEASASDEHFRVDGVSVTGQTAAPNSSCQLQVRIGEDGDWSDYQTATLTGTEAVYTLGDDNDNWGEFWDDADFANSNFELETRFNDPDGNCDASAVINLDHLQVRVHYEQDLDASQAALNAAQTAKTTGGSDGIPVLIFGIHFGDSSGQDFLESLSSTSFVSASTVTTATRSSGMATITTSAPHRLVKNQRVRVSGVSNSVFNGTVRITEVPTPNSFRYNVSSGSSGGTGGTVTPTNLFIAPGSSDMQAIFESIGYQICPAAAAACANTVDDDSDGLADAFDPACHTDGDAGNAATYDAADNDEWDAAGTPVPPPPPPPPPNISVGSWVETPSGGP